MSLNFRPVNEQDIATLCAFPQSAAELFFLYPKATFPLSIDQLQAAIAQRQDASVVEKDGQLVAFANFYRWENQGICAIGNVMVAPQARNKGIGRYLIERMSALAFNKYQASEVHVSCFNENLAELLLYPKLGFLPFAIEERKNPEGERVALLHLRLFNHKT